MKGWYKSAEMALEWCYQVFKSVRKCVKKLLITVQVFWQYAMRRNNKPEIGRRNVATPMPLSIPRRVVYTTTQNLCRHESKFED